MKSPLVSEIERTAAQAMIVEANARFVSAVTASAAAQGPKSSAWSTPARAPECLLPETWATDPTPATADIMRGITKEDLAQHTGKWVVCYGGRIVGAYDTLSDANGVFPIRASRFFVVLFVGEKTCLMQLNGNDR